MTIQPFDFGAAVSREHDDWKRRGLHWHCHLSRMSGGQYGDDRGRADLASTLAPRVVRDWLRKPQSTRLLAPGTPEDAVAWLRKQWGGSMPDARYAMALYELRCGNDVCWAEWVNNASVQLHTAVIATFDGCH